MQMRKGIWLIPFRYLEPDIIPVSLATLFVKTMMEEAYETQEGISPTIFVKLPLSNTLPKSNTKRGDAPWQLKKYPID